LQTARSSSQRENCGRITTLAEEMHPLRLTTIARVIGLRD
jgi:hypothetical protein